MTKGTRMGETIDAVALTQELVRSHTVNPPGNEAAIARRLGELLAGHGFRVEYYRLAPEREGFVARIGRGGKALGFTGHLDTVPFGAAPWARDPLAAEIVDGRMYGRGTTDMKAGVAAFCAAAVACKGAAANGPGVELVVTTGEETGSDGARAMAGQPGLLGAVGALVVAEPTSNYPMCGHKGAFWLKAVCTGVTAHGSMPEHGVNAAYKAGRVLTKLSDFGFNAAPHAVMGSPSLNVGTVQAGMNLNSVPDRAEVGIDIRSIPGIDHAAVKQDLERYLAPDIDAIEVLVDLPSVWTEPDEPWMRDTFAALEDILDPPFEARTATYFTDASILTPAYGDIPTLIMGPGEAAMAHQTDEYCEVARIEQAVAAYTRLIEAWQAG
jgi:succinyl-diaminopimelate desuccinylase